jgi:hypothetical protein
VAKTRASSPKDIGSIPDMGKNFRPSYPRLPNRLWNHPFGTRGCLRMVKRSRYEPGWLPVFSAEVKNGWS